MIKSALDLSKYNIGDKVYYIANESKLIQSRITMKVSSPKLIIKSSIIANKTRIEGRYYYDINEDLWIDQKDIFETIQGAKHHVEKVLKTILKNIKQQLNY